MKLVICLDGAELRLIRELGLPNLGSFKYLAEFRSHASSAACWISLITGIPPQLHGIKFSLPWFNSELPRGIALWEKFKGRIGIANIPVLTRAFPLNGWLICGFLGFPKEFAYPPQLQQELISLGYPSSFRDGLIQYLLFLGLGSINWFESQLERILAAKLKGFRHALSRYPVDLGIICIEVLDPIQHRFLSSEKLIEWYLKVDRAVGALMDLAQQTLVISDHGFRYGRLRLKHLLQELLYFKLPSLPSKLIAGIAEDHNPHGILISNLPIKIQSIEQLHQFILDWANEPS